MDNKSDLSAKKAEGSFKTQEEKPQEESMAKPQ
jgi:hypothetical protein